MPVNIILPEDNEQFALTINGKKRNIRKKDFFVFAKSAGMPEAAAKKILSDVASLKDTYMSMCKDSYLPKQLKTSLAELIAIRTNILS